MLIADGKNFMTTAWWVSVFPGIAIVITGLGFSLAGDGLAELLRAESMKPASDRGGDLKVWGLENHLRDVARRGGCAVDEGQSRCRTW